MINKQMTIDILSVDTITRDDGPTTRTAGIEISSGAEAYLFAVGGLPETGDLQPILDAREAALWSKAQLQGTPVDVYMHVSRRALKGLALVVLVGQFPGLDTDPFVHGFDVVHVVAVEAIQVRALSLFQGGVRGLLLGAQLL